MYPLECNCILFSIFAVFTIHKFSGTMNLPKALSGLGKEQILMKKVETTLEAVNGGHKYAICTGKRFAYPYDEQGKRKSDKPNAVNVDVALQGNSFLNVAIKIDGSTDLLPDLTDDDIKAACSAMKPYLVRFANCKISLYTINGEMRMSGTASGVELVQSK